MIRRLWPLFAVFALAWPIFYFGRGYPWPLAVIIAGAIAALAYSGWRAYQRLHDLGRRDREDRESR